jgi:hypothetical protein
LAAGATTVALDAGVVAALATERHHELTISGFEIPDRKVRHQGDM